MQGSRAAYRYAKAALSLAKEEKSEDAVNKDMKHIHETIQSSKDLENVLVSSVVRTEDKKAALFRIFPNLEKITVNTIDTLFLNNRVALLDDVAARFVSLYDEYKGTQVAKVTTAVPLTKELEAEVLAKVEQLTGKEVELVNVVDESILGGFILRVGDLQYNASIANKLNKLKREFSLN